MESEIDTAGTLVHLTCVWLTRHMKLDIPADSDPICGPMWPGFRANAVTSTAVLRPRWRWRIDRGAGTSEGKNSATSFGPPSMPTPPQRPPMFPLQSHCSAGAWLVAQWRFCDRFVEQLCRWDGLGQSMRLHRSNSAGLSCDVWVVG